MGGGSSDRVARGLPTGGQGSKVYVRCAEPKEHKHFRPGTRPRGSGTRPGGSVTGVTDKLSTVEFKNDSVLGFIICEIFTVIALRDWVGWGIFTVIPGYER